MKKFIYSLGNILFHFIIILLCVSILLSYLGYFIQSSHLNLSDYTPFTGTKLNEAQYDLYNEILDSFEREEYSIPYNISYDELLDVIDELKLYFGISESMLGASRNNEIIVFNEQSIKEAMLNKIIVDSRVDEALNNLIETHSERLNLLQISLYITRRIEYSQEDAVDSVKALNGIGVCRHYALLFYKMARRLGYECYICYGYSRGVLHAWNVVIIDGQEYFYDLTAFDSSPNWYYLHSKESFEREYSFSRTEIIRKD